MSSHLCRMSCIPALLCAVLVSACGDGKSAQSSSIAKAFEHVSDPAKNAEEAGDQMRKLKEKVEKDREAAITAEIEKAAVVPATLAKDIKSGCAEMREAYDGFVAKRLAGDAAESERWKVMKGVDLDPAVDFCVAHNNLQFAACEAHAFREVAQSVARERAPELIDACAKKTGVPTRADLADSKDAKKPS